MRPTDSTSCTERFSYEPLQLSDVEQGGATAFPFLNFGVRPQLGNILFWYNLHRSSDKDYRTKHAGCPVLKGSKWSEYFRDSKKCPISQFASIFTFKIVITQITPYRKLNMLSYLKCILALRANSSFRNLKF